MRLPFSYKNNLFSPLLFVSFLGHAVCLGAGGLVFSSPQFVVEQASSSLEVLILEEKETVREKNQSVRLLPGQESRVEEAEVPKAKPSERAKEKIEETAVSPLQQGALEEARPIHQKNPAPVYPLRAREAGWKGQVILKVLVAPDGRAAQAEILKSSGYPILDESALKAIRKWRFLPASAGSILFSSWIKIPVRFILLEEDPSFS